MKTKIYSLFVMMMSAVIFTGCDDTWKPGDYEFAKNTGGISLTSIDVDIDDNPNVVSRSTIDTSDFLVTITDKATGKTASFNNQECSWTYSEMPEVFTLPVGTYTAFVESHKQEKAAWATPYYQGSADFEIKDGEITSIGTVVCSFASVKVSVRYSEALKKVMSSDSEVNVVCNDEGALTWTSAETRAGYFEAVDGSTTLIATFNGTVQGQSVTKIKEFTDVKKGNYYIITFTLKSGDSTVPDEFGNIDPNGGITVDAGIEETDEPGNINPGDDPDTPANQRPGNEEWPDDPEQPENPDDPKDPDTTDAIKFTSTTLKLGEENSNDPSISPAVVVIAAKDGIAELNVKITTDNASFEESVSGLMPMEFDLANLDDDTAAALSSIGLPVNDEVKGKTSIDFDITALAPLLSSFPGTHRFIISVKDANGETNSEVLKYIAK